MISDHFLDACCTSELITLQYLCFTIHSFICETIPHILCTILHILPHVNAAFTWPSFCLYSSKFVAFFPITIILVLFFMLTSSIFLQPLLHILCVYEKKRLTISQSGLGQSSLVVKSSSSVSPWLHPPAYDPFHMSEAAKKLRTLFINQYNSMYNLWAISCMSNYQFLESHHLLPPNIYEWHHTFFCRLKMNIMMLDIRGYGQKFLIFLYHSTFQMTYIHMTYIFYAILQCKLG